MGSHSQPAVAVLTVDFCCITVQLLPWWSLKYEKAWTYFILFTLLSGANETLGISGIAGYTLQDSEDRYVLLGLLWLQAYNKEVRVRQHETSA